MRGERFDKEIDIKDLRYFIDRPKEIDGVKEGAYKYWLNDDNEIVAMLRLDREKVLNKKSKRFENKIIA